MERLPRRQLLLDMLIKEPDDIFLNYALAMEYISTNDLTLAETQLKKVLEINAGYLPCFYQLGQIYEKLNNNEAALDSYKQGVSLAKSQGNTKALGELNEAIWMLED